MSRRWSKRDFRWICKAGLQKPRLDPIPNDRDPQLLGFMQHVTLGISNTAFASIHFVDWHFHFATLSEQWTWQVNCAVMWGLLAPYGSMEVAICCKEGYSKLGLDTAGGYKLRFPACLLFLRTRKPLFYCAFAAHRSGFCWTKSFTLRCLQGGGVNYFRASHLD